MIQMKKGKRKLKKKSTINKKFCQLNKENNTCMYPKEKN